MYICFWTLCELLGLVFLLRKTVLSYHAILFILYLLILLFAVLLPLHS